MDAFESFHPVSAAWLRDSDLAPFVPAYVRRLVDRHYALKSEGARQVVAYCTHPVLSGSAVDRVNRSDLDALVVTDTIPLRDDAASSPRIRQLSVAGIMAETIRRISNDDSVSSLFLD